MRRIVAAALFTLILATVSAAHATDYDLRIGLRSFGPDRERWPEVGFSARIGPDRWFLKPVVGLALATELVYGGSITEASLGLGGDLPHRGRATWSWGLGYANLRYDSGVNGGSADAGYGELALCWGRPEEVDFGVVLRYLDGGDIALRYEGDPGFDSGFRESLSTVVVSFLMRW